MPSSPLSHQSTPTLRTTVTCMECAADITPRNPHTYAKCVACEQRVGFHDAFERGQQVRVPDDWIGEGWNLAGERGFIVGRCPGGAYDVALQPAGCTYPVQFVLYEYELEAVAGP